MLEKCECEKSVTGMKVKEWDKIKKNNVLKGKEAGRAVASVGWRSGGDIGAGAFRPLRFWCFSQAI